MIYKQMKMYDLESGCVLGAIGAFDEEISINKDLEPKEIICGCCGCTFDMDEIADLRKHYQKNKITEELLKAIYINGFGFAIVEVYDTWVDLTEELIDKTEQDDEFIEIVKNADFEEEN